MKLLVENQLLKKWILYFLILILFVSLFSFAYKGFFSRYLQDDYCYGKDVLTKGFITAQYEAYTADTEYNGNRYSLTLFSGIAELAGGTSFYRWISGISILLWLGALIFLVNQIQVLFLKKIEKRYSIAISLLVLVFSLYLAPDLYQIFYWRSGSFPYLFPIITNTFLAARGIKIGRSRKFIWSNFLEIALISFISVGFSETAAMWQLGLWSMAMFLILGLNRKKAHLSFLIWLFSTILVANLLGIFFLLISPNNAFHLSAASVKRPDLFTFLEKSFRYGFDFLYYSLKGKWLPFLVIFGFGAFLNMILENHLEISKKALGIYTLFLVVSIYLISVFNTVPTVLIRSVYPEERAWFPIHYLLIWTLFLLGFLTSELITKLAILKFPKMMRSIGILILGLFIVAYTGRMLPSLYAGILPLRARALAWDQREAWILQEKNLGKRHITVPAFDQIGGITELQSNENHWVNACAAKYYGVDGIIAVENFNGIKPYFK